MIRTGSKKALPVTLGRRSDARYPEIDKCDEPFFGIRNTHKSASDEGVAVDVVKNSTALALGMADGDVITHINKHRILDWDDISVAIDNMKVGDVISINYLREGKEQKGSESIKSYCDTKEDQSMGLRSAPNYIIRESSDRKDENKLNLNKVEVDLDNLSRQEIETMKKQSGAGSTSKGALTIEDLDVAPNPKEGMFKLQFNLPQQGATRVRVYNSSGRLIYDYDLGEFSGKFTDQLDIAQNGFGSYILEISQDNKQLLKKIKVQQS